MPSFKITVDLDADEYEALVDLAITERRSIPKQIEYLAAAAIRRHAHKMAKMADANPLGEPASGADRRGDDGDRVSRPISP